MSSHHIVRDEQEPALILHRLNQFPQSMLHALLEWSPTILSCEPAIEKFTSLGHKLDVALIGLRNFDHFKGLLEAQLPIKLVAVHGEDYLSTGLTIVQKDHHHAVNVVTSADCVFEVIQLMEQWIPLLDLVLYTEEQRILFVKTKTFKKWVAADTKLTAQSLDGQACWSTVGSDIELLDYESDTCDLMKRKEGEVTIHCSQTPFLVIEEL